MATDIATEYKRLIKNLDGYPSNIRDPLIKSASATGTTLNAIENKILNDKVAEAVVSFTKLLDALNDVLEEVSLLEPTEPSFVDSEPSNLPLPAGVINNEPKPPKANTTTIKPKDTKEDRASDPISNSSTIK